MCIIWYVVDVFYGARVTNINVLRMRTRDEHVVDVFYGARVTNINVLRMRTRDEHVDDVSLYTHIHTYISAAIFS